MYIEIPRGDQKPLNFKIKNKSGEYLKPSDLQEIIMTCRQSPNKTSSVLFQKKLSNDTVFYDEQNESFTIKILSNDTKDLGYCEYGFDIEIKAGDIIDTHIGKIKITEEYTMEA